MAAGDRGPMVVFVEEEGASIRTATLGPDEIDRLSDEPGIRLLRLARPLDPKRSGRPEGGTSP